MQQIQLALFIIFLSFSLKTRAQQEYPGNSELDCKSQPSPPSSSYLYTCNGQNPSCHTFLIYNSQPKYNTVSSISKLLSSDPVELARINNVTDSYVFPVNKEVIVPLNCSCSGQYYQANTSFIISDNDTYYELAKDVYQGLSSCSALIGENPYDFNNLYGGLEVFVPLRCACPTRNQTKDGIKYLLTYSVWDNDTVPDLSYRFNVSSQNTILANELSEQNLLIFETTTILIPLPREPLSNQTIIHFPIPNPPPPPPPQSTVPETKRSNKGLHVGIGVGAAFLVAVCAALLFAFWHYKKSMNRAAKEKRCVLPKDVLITKADVDHELKVFDFGELKTATNDFSLDFRIGGSSVYRGVVRGSVLAIKEMRKDATMEVSILHKLNHFNLISLCGVSMSEEHCYLVYEFMENGSLNDWLHHRSQSALRSWSRRVQIALDVASGLHYLHHFAEPPYVHKDIKSSNILLDKNLRAKIANFSLARSSDRREGGFNITRNVEGTLGYMAPEYLESGVVTPKLDVYAFGVVMLELITGKDAIIMHEGTERLLSAVIISLVKGRNAEAELSEFMDSAVRDSCPINLALAVAKLSVACLRQDPGSRPTMDEVVSILSIIQRDSSNQV